jgi:hypothetical protein
MARRIVRVVALIGVIDFALFVIAALYLGGDAMNGHRQGNRYFLALHSKGPFTEVSRSTFLYSEWHVASLLVIFGVVLVADLAFRMMGRRAARQS